MAKKATPEELEAARKLDAALEAEENAALSPVSETAPVVEPAAAPDVAGNDAGVLPPVNSETPKRRPGRPKQSDAERALKESLGQPSDSANTGTGGAKRGPKPKAKGSDATTLGKSLVGIHQLVAMVTGIQEAQISEQEGQMLAEAFCAVCEEYGFAVSGKAGAAVQLFGAVAMIYGPRAFFYKQRVMAMRAQQGDQNGTTFAPGN